MEDAGFPRPNIVSTTTACLHAKLAEQYAVERGDFGVVERMCLELIQFLSLCPSLALCAASGGR